MSELTEKLSNFIDDAMCVSDGGTRRIIDLSTSDFLNEILPEIEQLESRVKILSALTIDETEKNMVVTIDDLEPGMIVYVPPTNLDGPDPVKHKYTITLVNGTYKRSPVIWANGMTYFILPKEPMFTTWDSALIWKKEELICMQRIASERIVKIQRLIDNESEKNHG